MEDSLPLIINRKKTPPSSYREDFLPLVNNSKTKVANHVTLVEKVLISKLKVADKSAFSTVFTAYYKDLVMFASRFTHDLNNAEEIVQDTFVRLWEEHESLKVSTSLKSYLLKMVQNKCIDWYRHKKIMQTHNDFVKEGSPQFDYDTDSYILHSEMQEQIEAALKMLPEAISEVFRMSRYKGLKYHEIADLLGVSVRTIEVRIGKALHMLRDHLKEYFFIIPGALIMLYG
jgi:RNA polymerase sigma-70 factor (ECF subfamily)